MNNRVLLCVCVPRSPSLRLSTRTGGESPDLRAFQREVQSKGSIVQKAFVCTRLEEEGRKEGRGKDKQERGKKKKKKKKYIEGQKIKAERVKSEGPERGGGGEGGIETIKKVDL